MGIKNITYREAKKMHETSYATAIQNRETNNVPNVLLQLSTSVSKKKRKSIEGGNPLLQEHLAILKTLDRAYTRGKF